MEVENLKVRIFKIIWLEMELSLKNHVLELSTKYNCRVKIQKIIELGLTMLFHASIPKRFWVEAFAIVTWLINYLSSNLVAVSPLKSSPVRNLNTLS